ncbi:MAG: oligosaccharide flippase family protein [Candidatus Bostrichicola ureolyticus]|nr:MAG: oligosaccharide flippase family protein [Candidatus Bostrichicola ureolyticus]
MYKQLLNQIFTFGLGTVFPKIINYFLLKSLTKTLNSYEFSIYTDMYAMSCIIIVFLTLGLESSYFRFLYKRKIHDKKKIFSSGVIILFILSLLFIIIGIILFKPIISLINYKNHSEYLIMFLIIIFLDTICILPMAWLRIHNIAIKYLLIRILNVVLQAVIIMYMFYPIDNYLIKNIFNIILFPLNFFVKNINNASYIFYANVISSLSNFILLIPIFLKVKIKKFDIVLAFKMITYGVPIMLSTLAFAINENIDKIIIKRYFSDEINSAYAACYRISTFMHLYNAIFRLGLEPFMLKKAEEANIKNIYVQINYFLTVLGIIIYVFICSNIDFIASKMIDVKYHKALLIVPIATLSNLFFGIYNNLSIYYKAFDKPMIGTYISILGMLITLLYNIIILPLSGSNFIICSGANLVSYGSMLLCSYICINKIYYISFNKKKILIHFILAILIVILLYNKKKLRLIGQIIYFLSILLIEYKNIFFLFKKIKNKNYL